MLVLTLTLILLMIDAKCGSSEAGLDLLLIGGSVTIPKRQENIDEQTQLLHAQRRLLMLL
jgi:hypothetical protein